MEHELPHRCAATVVDEATILAEALGLIDLRADNCRANLRLHALAGHAAILIVLRGRVLVRRAQ